jgi:hypothetical protein
MKNLKALLVAVVLVALCVPGFAAGSSNESNPQVITFALGTTIAASATESVIYRIPKSAKIDSIYVTNLSTIGVDADNNASITFFLNNAAYGNLSTAVATITAVTPKILTPTGTALSAGDTVQFKLGKGGTGAATTNMGVTLQYHNTDSR